MEKINLYFIQKKFKMHFWDKGFPIWFRILNLIPLIPIFIWPLVAFASIFLLDNPKNLFFTFITIILVDAYPLYLIFIAFYSFKLFNKNRLISILLPLIPIGIYILGFILLLQNAGKY